MLGRIFISALFLISLSWVAYVGFDILNESNSYNELYLFSHSDEQILIINRTDEASIQQINGFAVAPLSQELVSIKDSIVDKMFVSALRPHALLISREGWSQEKIKSLFQNKNINFQSEYFEINDLKGRFYKKRLYIWKGTIEYTDDHSQDYLYDLNASACIIYFNENNTVHSISDIYVKGNGKVDYITNNSNIQQGNQIKDEFIFSGSISNKISDYHFYERDYYATIDSIFNKGPMVNWLDKGFVILNYGGNRAIVTDYIGGQDPLLVLNDIAQSSDGKEFNLQLTENFPSNGSSFFIKYLEDLVVISESEAICDKIIADQILGQTIALDESKRRQLFGSLPNAVSERSFTRDHSYSKAIYKGKILETHIGQQIIAPVKEKKSTITLNCGTSIKDFQVLPGEGNVVALGIDGKVSVFKDGSISWEKNLQETILGGVQIIDLHYNGNSFVLLNSEDKIYLWTIDGEMVSGFPISSESSLINEVKFYRWRGQSYLIASTEGKKVVQYDSKGRELNIIRTPFEVTRKIDVWASQNKLFAGFANNTQFQMYNLDNYRKHREFALPAKSLASKIPNELLQYGFDAEQLYKIDQKGIRFNFSQFPNAQLLKLITENGNPSLIVKSNNEILLLNGEGIPFAQIALPFNEVQDVFIHNSNSGETTIAIVDGLENNVYLYELNGQLSINKPIEGQTKVQINLVGSSRLISTVVDEFVVQYFE